MRRKSQRVLSGFMLKRRKGVQMHNEIWVDAMARAKWVEKDLKEEVKYYRLSAAQGNAAAQNNLGGAMKMAKGWRRI